MSSPEKRFSAQPASAFGPVLAEVIDDRRRPARLDCVHPTLIPLLRGAFTPDLLLPEETDVPLGRGYLAPAQGIAVALALSVPLWAVIGLGVWAMRG